MVPTHPLPVSSSSQSFVYPMTIMILPKKNLLFLFLLFFSIIFLLLPSPASASASSSEQQQQQQQEHDPPPPVVSTDTASLQKYLATHDMESLHQALSIRFHESERMIDPKKRVTPLPPNKIQRGSGLDYTTRYKLQADLEQIVYLIELHLQQRKRMEHHVITNNDNAAAFSSSSFYEEKLNLFIKAKNAYQQVLDQMPSDEELEPNGGFYKFQYHDIQAGILEYYNRALYRPEVDSNGDNDSKHQEAEEQQQRQQGNLCRSKLTADNMNEKERICSANANSDLGLHNILNPDLDWKAIEKEYWNQDPQVVVIDNILTKDALHQIRKILLESTVFYQAKRPNIFGGYTGAYIDDGLHDRILLELTSELRKQMPSVLQPHALRYLWAYKYDSNYQGIKLHADMAAVNVNLWITPDEANEDPDSGGLVVFTVKPPPEWDILQYNSDTEKVYDELLKPAGYRNITIPHKENRAVLFDSALFHQTDQFHFKSGYTNRRINLTILYGDMQTTSTK